MGKGRLILAGAKKQAAGLAARFFELAGMTERGYARAHADASEETAGLADIPRMGVRTLRAVAAEQAGLSDSAGGYGVTAITEKILSSVAWQAPPTCVSIDAFAVGGGGGGVQGGGGGGGGYTALLYSIATVPGEVLAFTVGNGGAAGGGNGEASSIKRGDTVLITAAGGYGASGSNGGNGGSGGGGGYNGSGYGSGGNGGSNGGNGTKGGGDDTPPANPGTGQGTSTTCPFDGITYAGGGGGSGTGAWSDGSNGTNGGGAANTGGGGRAVKSSAAAGGSGIIIIGYRLYQY